MVIPIRFELSFMRHLSVKCELSDGTLSENKSNQQKSKYFKNSFMHKLDHNNIDNFHALIKSENYLPVLRTRWAVIHKKLREMRDVKDAPVDSMGAQCLYDVEAHPKVKRFHILVSLMLSSQTKDHITAKAIKKLQEINLTVENVSKMDEHVLQSLIYPVGFYKRKAKYLKETAQILIDKYEGDIPKTLEELCQLPGVGHKMAFLALDIAWDKVEGIAVDTHVHRISNRLQIVKEPTKTPEKTRLALESWLPREYWREINYLLVGFGQQICLPVKPKCHTCLLRPLCPYFKDKNTVSENA